VGLFGFVWYPIPERFRSVFFFSNEGIPCVMKVDGDRLRKQGFLHMSAVIFFSNEGIPCVMKVDGDRLRKQGFLHMSAVTL